MILDLSSSINLLLIYSFIPSSFRYGFKMVFRWCLFVRVGTEPFSRRENLTSRYSCSGSPDHNRIKRNGRFEHSQLKQEGVYANELHIDRYPEIDTLYLSQLTQVASNFAQR